MNSAQEAFENRMREWAADPSMKALAGRLLDLDEQELVVSEQRAEYDRVSEIYRRARRLVQTDTILMRMAAQGWRLLDTVGEHAAEVGRQLYELFRPMEGALRAPVFGVNNMVEIVVERPDAIEQRYPARLNGPVMWQARGILAIELIIPHEAQDLNEHHGWTEALLLLKLTVAGNDGQPLKLFAYPCWPVRSETNEEHCRLTYEVPFPPGQRGPHGTPVPLEAFAELRLLPLPD